MGAWIGRHPWLALVLALVVGLGVGVLVGVLSGSVFLASGVAGAAGGAAALIATRRKEDAEVARERAEEDLDLAEAVLTEQERRRVADDEIDGLAAAKPQPGLWDDKGGQPPP